MNWFHSILQNGPNRFVFIYHDEFMGLNILDEFPSSALIVVIEAQIVQSWANVGI